MSYRWGNTAVDEAIKTGNKQLIELLDEAKSAQLSELPGCLEGLKGIVKTYNDHMSHTKLVEKKL